MAKSRISIHMILGLPIISMVGKLCSVTRPGSDTVAIVLVPTSISISHCPSLCLDVWTTGILWITSILLPTAAACFRTSFTCDQCIALCRMVSTLSNVEIGLITFNILVRTVRRRKWAYSQSRVLEYLVYKTSLETTRIRSGCSTRTRMLRKLSNSIATHLHGFRPHMCPAPRYETSWRLSKITRSRTLSPPTTITARLHTRAVCPVSLWIRTVSKYSYQPPIGFRRVLPLPSFHLAMMPAFHRVEATPRQSQFPSSSILS